jgi:transcriptional accessory protein Tex/SPT6
MAELNRLIQKHRVELIAIGNGTASRETDRLVAEVIATLPAPKPIKVVVSEAGASVYSASAKAAAEMPDLDVSLRGAVSIARRLQDPLAELVKIDPKAIGVGQYQHDVNQTRLARALDAVVEDAVNAVGVDLNTASASLLSRVSGLSASLAGAISFTGIKRGLLIAGVTFWASPVSAPARLSFAPDSCGSRTDQSHSTLRRCIPRPMGLLGKSWRPVAAMSVLSWATWRP